ncbi:hypothetical protein BS78_09G199500 [Paspalum vaginatum]|nr:hypothetical protein BS78_09G199500 [Paspalum vaginatum]
MPRRACHDPAPPACCSCCCGCADAPPCYSYPAPAPAPPGSAASDHLLHAIAAHLLLSSPAPAQPQQQQPPPPPPAAHHATNPYPHPHHQYQYQFQQQEAKPHGYTHPPPQQRQPNPSGDHGHILLHSLLRRVAALESALPRCFPTPPPARRPPRPDPRPRRAPRYQEEEDEEEEEGSEHESPPSPPPRRRRPAREAPRPSAATEHAARTIQAHFRRFLARRSRTLRQLKDLAVLRSKAAAIRGSLSGRRGGAADPAAVSDAAMELLLRLDAIQGGDPMIREGKRAVSRELTRILEFVDKVLVREHHEQVAMGDALDNDGYAEGCNAPFVAGRPAMGKKKVSFSGNGQVHKANREMEKGNEVDEGSEGSSSAESDEVEPGKRSANGKPGLAAPTPVHMESRR